MENTHKRLEALLQAMPPISLAEMSEIRLMKRTDQKYLTNIDTLAELLRLTRDDYYTQEIDGRRISPYATTYWDDENEAFFHFHQAGHRPRRKVRVRTYVGSGQSFLEVKRKDNHGKTFKSRVTVPSLEAVLNDRAGQDFLQEKTGFDFSQLRPTVANRFYRITLVNRGKTERLTIDFDIRFRNLKTGREAAMDHIVRRPRPFPHPPPPPATPHQARRLQQILHRGLRHRRHPPREPLQEEAHTHPQGGEQARAAGHGINTRRPLATAASPASPCLDYQPTA